ncbi:MAG TPA: Eco57I restriction-modification methylase domain-containing protein [Solirubrobacteraceae bacterium]
MAYAQQPPLGVEAHAASLAASALDDGHDYGAVFTRRWVVELILDLVGYTSDRDLAALRAIEPACGAGAFLGPMVERLSRSCQLHDRHISDAARAIRACDLQPTHVVESRSVVEGRLLADGRKKSDARTLAQDWVEHDDFLLGRHELGDADFVIGNPPYIRLEAVSDARNAAYRRACLTMGGRADVYVGFFEVGLNSLRPGGALGFICADRWMRNQYGQRLRSMVTAGFSVDTVIEMHDVEAFEQDVSAYPSVTVLRRAPQGSAIIATAKRGFDETSARRVRIWASRKKDLRLSDPTCEAARLPTWFGDVASWPSGSPERLAVVARLERDLPTLEDGNTRTRVGIGVATGADRVFVTKDPTLVENDRALPLAMARDTAGGEIQWSGHHLVNPWDGDTGALVSLADYPKLKAYFDENATDLRRRNVAGRRPQQWYRTIDRVAHSLTDKPKLLIPDIKASIHPVLDPGGLYPHHNLYWVMSERWDAQVLGGLLLSSVAQMFVECYAVKMRGGYLRFQAQYLRRIRVPRHDSVPQRTARELVRAFEARDVERATAAALDAYGLEELPE